MSSLKTMIGVCAFNEEYNISFLLQNLISEQNLPKDCRILVVCSGCTDRTLKVVKEFQSKDKRIEPIIEKTRKGKANALNRIFENARESADILILVNADALPKRGSIGNLVSELGNATITNGTSVNGSNSLTITAQAVPSVREWELRYAYWVEREIFASNDSDVTLSFYLNATQGFGGNDTFALLISNIQRSQTIVIATPNGIYQSYPSAAILDDYQGLFSYNLSEMWRQVFNSSLPQTFVLQLANYDFDGIPSVAYVDNITATSASTAYP